MKTTYTAADAEYLDQRRLRRHARVLHLWAMGVGAVISGDFFGWNFGLTAGGFGGMLLAVVVMTVMYIGLCFSIAEMSPALPHAGGAYSFARTSMGPWGGYITGLAENMEYILTPAVIVVGIGGYLGAIFGTPHAWEPLWWLLCYGVFVALNIWGVEMSFHVSVVVTLVAHRRAGCLLGGRRAALRSASLGRALLSRRHAAKPRSALSNCRSRSGCTWGSSNCRWRPKRATIPKRDMPRGILYGLVTLIAISFLTVVLSAGIAPGAAQGGDIERAAVSRISNHLRRGNQNAHAGAVRLHRPDRQLPHHHLRLRPADLFALARRILPHLALGDARHARRRRIARCSPASALGFVVALAIHLTPQGSPVGAILLNMAVFGAVLAYILQMVVVHPAARSVSAHGAAVRAARSELPARRSRVADRGRHARDSLPQSGLQQGRDRRGASGFCCGIAYYAVACAATGWCSRPKRNRPHRHTCAGANAMNLRGTAGQGLSAALRR